VTGTVPSTAWPGPCLGFNRQAKTEESAGDLQARSLGQICVAHEDALHVGMAIQLLDWEEPLNARVS
jgi:hypothetical protein